MLIIVILSIMSVWRSEAQETFNQSEIPLFSDKHIEYINNLNSTWEATRNFPADSEVTTINGLFGAFIRKKKKKQTQTIVHDTSDDFLPAYFDARKKWPDCPTIGDILDQSGCGSCWAVSVASVFSDRVCIHSKGKHKTPLSAQEILTCCNNCGFGCKGGDIYHSWEYIVDYGITTGGKYDDKETCLPYSLPPCEHGALGRRIDCIIVEPDELLPLCERKCQPSSNDSFTGTRFYAKRYYKVEATEEQIMREIMINGPVVAAVLLNTDFVLYSSGVYQPLSGKAEIGHAFKILGWGFKRDVKYWLCANSWNTDWGKEDGFFKILRGENTMHIRDGILAAIPSLSDEDSPPPEGKFYFK